MYWRKQGQDGDAGKEDVDSTRSDDGWLTWMDAVSIFAKEGSTLPKNMEKIFKIRFSY